MGPLVAFLASSRLRVDRKVESDLAKRSFRTPFLLIRMFLFFAPPKTRHTQPTILV